VLKLIPARNLNKDKLLSEVLRHIILMGEVAREMCSSVSSPLNRSQIKASAFCMLALVILTAVLVFVLGILVQKLASKNIVCAECRTGHLLTHA